MLWTVLPRLWLVCAQYESIAFSQLCCFVLLGLNAFTPVSVQLCMRAPSDSPCSGGGCLQNEKGMQGIDSRVRNPRVKGASSLYFCLLPTQACSAISDHLAQH